MVEQGQGVMSNSHFYQFSHITFYIQVPTYLQNSQTLGTPLNCRNIQNPRVCMHQPKVEEFSPFPPDPNEDPEESQSSVQLEKRRYHWSESEGDDPHNGQTISDGISIGSIKEYDNSKQLQLDSSNRMENRENIYGQEDSLSSIVSIMKETSLSGDMDEENPKKGDDDIGAFSDREYGYQFKPSERPTSKDTSPEPTERQIKTAIEVLQIEFNDKDLVKLITTLFARLSEDSLSRIESQYPLSNISNVSQNSEEKKNSEQSQIELESISEDNSKKVEDAAESQKRNSLRLQQLKERRLKSLQIVQELQIIQKQRKKQKDPSRQNSRIRRDHSQTMKNYGPFLNLTNQYSEKRPNNITVFSYKPVLKTQQQKRHYKQKRIVAKAFIRRGYGLPHLRRELIQTNNLYRFEESRYKTVVYAVAIETLRKLQEFLDENCPSYGNKSISKLEAKTICPFLLNCRDNFPSESGLFLKLMQVQFNVDVESVVVNRKEATELYERIQKHFLNRESSDYKTNFKERQFREYRPPPPIPRPFCDPYRETKPTQRSYLPEPDYTGEDSWSHDNECQLLDLYKQTRNVSGVRDKYRQKYGPGTMYEDCKMIKSRLYKGLRAAIRKLKICVLENRELSDYGTLMNNLNNQKIKRILISTEASDTRAALCEFYNKSELNLGETRYLIDMMEAVLNKIERRKGGYPFYA